LAAKNRPWSFANSSTSDKVNAPTVARWVKDHNIKKVAIIYDNKDRVSKGFGTIVAPGLAKKHGINIVATQTFITTDVDYSAQITSIKASKPDGLMVGATPAIGARVVTTARRLGLNVPVIGDIPLTGELYLTEGKQYVEGTYVSGDLWYGRPDERQQAFQKRFQGKHINGHLPHTVSIAMYDNLLITKMCIEKYGVTNDPAQLEQDRDKIRRCWQELKDFPGVAGDISIDERGDARKTYYMLKAVKGKWVRMR
jgi:branched-chain amino acid transport system substrate-binding protein